MEGDLQKRVPSIRHLAPTVLTWTCQDLDPAMLVPDSRSNFPDLSPCQSALVSRPRRSGCSCLLRSLQPATIGSLLPQAWIYHHRAQIICNLLSWRLNRSRPGLTDLNAGRGPNGGLKLLTAREIFIETNRMHIYRMILSLKISFQNRLHPSLVLCLSFGSSSKDILRTT